MLEIYVIQAMATSSGYCGTLVIFGRHDVLPDDIPFIAWLAAIEVMLRSSLLHCRKWSTDVSAYPIQVLGH